MTPRTHCGRCGARYDGTTGHGPGKCPLKQVRSPRATKGEMQRRRAISTETGR